MNIETGSGRVAAVAAVVIFIAAAAFRGEGQRLVIGDSAGGGSSILMIEIAALRSQ